MSTAKVTWKGSPCTLQLTGLATHMVTEDITAQYSQQSLYGDTLYALHCRSMEE